MKLVLGNKRSVAIWYESIKELLNISSDAAREIDSNLDHTLEAFFGLKVPEEITLILLSNLRNWIARRNIEEFSRSISI